MHKGSLHWSLDNVVMVPKVPLSAYPIGQHRCALTLVFVETFNELQYALCVSIAAMHGSRAIYRASFHYAYPAIIITSNWLIWIVPLALHSVECYCRGGAPLPGRRTGKLEFAAFFLFATFLAYGLHIVADEDCDSMCAWLHFGASVSRCVLVGSQALLAIMHAIAAFLNGNPERRCDARLLFERWSNRIELSHSIVQ
jgi:hypothetical protein